MNREQFFAILKLIYKSVDSPYSYEDARKVFETYFDYYEAYTGHEHPPISFQQLWDILAVMPYYNIVYVDPEHPDIAPYEYPNLIAAYFMSNFRSKTDRNMIHFFSGDIRYYRSMELATKEIVRLKERA